MGDNLAHTTCGKFNVVIITTLYIYDVFCLKGYRNLRLSIMVNER